jgi:hypothetical protein
MKRASFHLALLLAASVLLSSCGLNMYEQPNARVFEPLPFDDSRSSMQPILEGTVSRNRGAVDPVFFSGQSEGGLASELPFPVTLEVLERGQERFNIYCAPCHNYTGDGLGVIVQRGMVQPRSFHDPAVRGQPVGYFFNAATNGFGRMFSYASRVPPEDRWAISAYIKALQLSQFATPEDAAAAQEPQSEGAADE